MKKGLPKKPAKRRAPQREMFVREFLVDRNATQAAIRCGYSKKAARTQGSRLMANENIRAEIEKRTQKIGDALDITAERVISELALIAFSDPRDYAKWGSTGVTLEDSSTIDAARARCIAEVSSSPGANGTTIKLKFHDKKGALELLGKKFKLFTDRTELDASDELKELLAMSRE